MQPSVSKVGIAKHWLIFRLFCPKPISKLEWLLEQETVPSSLCEWKDQTDGWIGLRRESGPRRRRPELAIRRLLGHFKADTLGMQAMKLSFPKTGLKVWTQQEPQGTCRPSIPGGAGLKEVLALLFKAFKSKAVKSRSPNTHIMWEKVLGRKWGRRGTVQLETCTNPDTRLYSVEIAFGHVLWFEKKARLTHRYR